MIFKAIKDMMLTVCGSSFDYVGATSTDSIKPLLMHGVKYFVVYQDVDDGILTFMKHNLDLGLNNLSIVDPILKNSEAFNVMLKRHQTQPFTYEDIAHFMIENRKFNSVWRIQWRNRYKKDLVTTVNTNAEVFWIRCDEMFDNYKERMNDAYEFLELENSDRVEYEESFSSGHYDYPHQSVSEDLPSMSCERENEIMEFKIEVDQYFKEQAVSHI